MTDRADLHEVIRRAVDPVQLMQRVADQALALVPGAEGVLVGLVSEDSWLTYVCASGYLVDRVGDRLLLEGSLSGLAIGLGSTLCVDDAETDPRVDLDACRRFGVASSVCVPLRRGQSWIGMLSVSASRPRAFGDADLATFNRLAEFVSIVIGAAADLTGATSALLPKPEPGGSTGGQAPGDDVPEAEGLFMANVLSPGVVGDVAARRRIEQVIETGGFKMVFQPLFDLGSGALFGAEALARFPGTPERTPDVWIAEAHAVGLGVELELAAVRAALACQDRLPAEAFLAVNAGPDVMASPELSLLIELAKPERIVMELTEQAKVDDYPRLLRALEGLRRLGTRFAIDDTGAGFASLAHILKLAPDMIKLDRALTSGIDLDPVRRALAAALMSFASETGAVIVAEGIATLDELTVLRELGIAYGQGYYLGRPMPIAAIPKAVRLLSPSL